MVPVYTSGDIDVVSPTAVSQVMPRWVPPTFEVPREYAGTIEILIETDGTVLSAAIRNSVHPLYDRELWVTDGTGTGTHLVKDINPSISASPLYLQGVGDKLYLYSHFV